jgi:septal ring factor EnvC (AmiA/AmiB activator)
MVNLPINANPAAINTADANLQSQITTNTGNVATNTSDITNLKSSVLTLQSQVATLQSQVSTLQSQVATLTAQFNGNLALIADLDNRVDSIETGQVFYGPYVGTSVHLRNLLSECIPAITIRDASQADEDDIISVIHLDTDRETRRTIWKAVYDIRQEIGADPPMTAWHIPENQPVIAP